MAALSDHIRRDAEHAMRAEISIEISKYVRRLAEAGKGHIKEAIEEATNSGEAIDGTALGRAAANRAVQSYIGAGEPHAAIDAPETPSEPSAGEAG